MLGKRQYWITLLVAVAIFFILFATTYFYSTNSPTVKTQVAKTVPLKQDIDVTSDFNKPKQVCILPSTSIILRTLNQKNELLDTVQLNAVSLLGFTEDDFKAKFKDYSVETFSEDRVTLVRNIEVLPEQELKEEIKGEGIYILGIEEDEVCIKLKGNQNALIRLGRKATDFSSYIYSLLLKENITLTTAQKEMLSKNPKALEKVLQDYIGE